MARFGINRRIYKRVDLHGNQQDVIEIVGEMDCKANALSGACEKKCEGKVWIGEKGRKYCPHPYGLAWVRINV
jgi:hypothetical protein